jgi:hypothetical protein
MQVVLYTTSPAPPMHVVLNTTSHAGPLCDVARFHLERERERTPFDLRVVAVDGDPRLAIRHALRVPVIEIDGVEAMHGKIEPDALRAALRGRPSVARRP